MKRVLYSLTVVICFFCYLFTYANAVGEEISSDVLRFHIIANSNSEYDQRVKLALRDYVSLNMKRIKDSPYSKEYVSKIEKLSDEWLMENGTGYESKAVLERCYIPRKSYMDITMPQGRYNALKLTLGDGKGDNWWCVAYPSLCFSEEKEGELSEEGKAQLEETMPKDCYEIISNEKKYRFWIVDFISGIKEKIY